MQTILSTILHLNRDISYGRDLLLIAGKINYCAFERLYSEPHSLSLRLSGRGLSIKGFFS